MTLRIRRVVLVLVAALCLLPLVGCEEKITVESFDKIQTGMTIYEVEKIMGGKGTMEERSGSNISSGGIATGSGGATEQVYSWRKANKEITVTVKDGKVLRKGKSVEVQ
jgi:hypothetical protein